MKIESLSRSGSHAEQTGRVMIGYEKVCMEQRPDWSWATIQIIEKKAREE